MISIDKHKKEEYSSSDFYKTCCQLLRPDVEHKCDGVIQWEHPWSRSNNMNNIVVPVCSSSNYSPDKKTKMWSRLVAMNIYGLDNLKKLHWKKDWDAEKKLCESFFI